MKTPKELALLAARALSDKKGKEIRVMEIAELTTLADYFVLATGASNTQINALVDNVEKVLAEEAGEQPLHVRAVRQESLTVFLDGCQHFIFRLIFQWDAVIGRRIALQHIVKALLALYRHDFLELFDVCLRKVG